LFRAIKFAAPPRALLIARRKARGELSRIAGPDVKIFWQRSPPTGDVAPDKSPLGKRPSSRCSRAHISQSRGRAKAGPMMTDPEDQRYSPARESLLRPSVTSYCRTLIPWPLVRDRGSRDSATPESIRLAIAPPPVPTTSTPSIPRFPSVSPILSPLFQAAPARDLTIRSRCLPYRPRPAAHLGHVHSQIDAGRPTI